MIITYTPYHLVSDASASEGWTSGGPNSGITLPDSKTATYDAGLSPLYITRAGFTIGWLDGWARVAGMRGAFGYLRTITTYSNIWSHYLMLYSGNLYPSAKDANIYSYSLRCLVSTNNS